MAHESTTVRLARALTRRPNWAGKGLLAIAALFLLQAAKPILVPVAVALVMVFTLSPLVRWLQQSGIPRQLGAALVLATLLATITTAGILLTRPAVDWWESTPNNLHQLVESFDRLRATVPLFAPPKPLSGRVRQSLPPPADPLKEKLTSEGVAFTGVVLRHFGSLVLAAAATLILSYLLLLSERWLITHIANALPLRRQRAQLLIGLRDTQREISHYFATMGIINLGLGVATGIAMAILGVPNPALWGVVAGVLNFIPYFGPLVTTLLLTLTGVTFFNDFFDMLAPPLLFLAIIVLESNWLSPWIIGRRLKLNQLAIFFSVLAWGWIWGVSGAFLAVPVLIGLRCIMQRRHNRLLCALLAPNSGIAPPFAGLLASSSVTSAAAILGKERP